MLILQVKKGGTSKHIATLAMDWFHILCVRFVLFRILGFATESNPDRIIHPQLTSYLLYTVLITIKTSVEKRYITEPLLIIQINNLGTTKHFVSLAIDWFHILPLSFVLFRIHGFSTEGNPDWIIHPQVLPYLPRTVLITIKTSLKKR